VTFSSDGNPLGTAVLTGGKATLTTSALPAGSRTMTANYDGNPTVLPGTGALTQTVNTAAMTTTLISSTSPSLPGHAVTFTATVTSPAGAPTGTVTFASDGNALGTVGAFRWPGNADHLGVVRWRPRDRGRLHRRRELRRE
jgi:hypothetical protein